MANTLHKVERLDKKKIIERMFAGGSRSFSIFSLHVVCLPVEELEADAFILISVSERRFERAVKYNRARYQIRKVYCVNKHGLLDTLVERKRRLAIAFIYLSGQLMEPSIIEDRMGIALVYIIRRMAVLGTDVPSMILEPRNGCSHTCRYFPFTPIRSVFRL